MKVEWKKCDDLETIVTGIQTKKLEFPQITKVEADNDNKFWTLPKGDPKILVFDHEYKVTYEKENGLPLVWGGGISFEDVFIQYNAIVDMSIYDYTYDRSTSKKFNVERDVALGVLLAGPLGGLVGAGVSLFQGPVHEYLLTVNYWNLETKQINTCIAYINIKDEFFLKEFVECFQENYQKFYDNGCQTPPPSKGCLVFLAVVISGLSALTYGGYSLISSLL